jgi:hypothetical protein
MPPLPLSKPPLGIPFTLNKASPQARGLVAWWPTIANINGNRIFDRARTYHAALTGNPTWGAAAVVGSTLNLDGSGDYADAGNVTLGMSGDAAYSITLWVNASAVTSDGMWFSYGSANASRVISIGSNSTNFYVVHYGNDHAFSVANTLNTLQHVAITYNPLTSTETLYIDGAAVDSWTPTDLSLVDGEALNIGRAVWNGAIAGACKLADIRLYNRALSANEVFALYAPQTRWQLYQPLVGLGSYRVPDPVVEPPAGLTAIIAMPRARSPVSARVTYAAWLCNPLGYRVQLIPDFVSLQYGLSIKGGSNFKMELSPNVDTTYLKDLGFVEIWRKCGGRTPYLEDVFVIQSNPKAQARRGTRFISIEGPNVTDYMLGSGSRIASFIQGATGASYTTYADNAAKGFVHNALGAGAGNTGTSLGRDLSSYFGFRVEANRSLGPEITEDGYQKPLSDVLASIAKKSEEATSSPRRLYYIIRPYSFNPLRFEFVTLVDYFGRYRGFTSASPVILSPMFGSVSSVDRENDHREEVTSVFITYLSKASTTRITDTARRDIAPLGFREAYKDATASADETAAQDEARSVLNDGKPRNLTRMRIVSSANQRYGVDYYVGDVVGALALGGRWEGEIQGVSVGVGKAAGLDEVQVRVDDWQALT